MTALIASASASLDAVCAGKFAHPDRTADGKARARVPLRELCTLWFNTGTLCNLACGNCYIESSPRNDRLVYLDRGEVAAYLREAARFGAAEIGFTGGEPFMNPDFPAMLADALEAGFDALVLTNAMRPMMKRADELLALRALHGRRLTVRVSVDHFRRTLHEEERGRRSWQPTLAGLRWLSDNRFRVHVAGRQRWGDDEATLRDGFAALFATEGVRVDAYSPQQLVLFPEMDAAAETPEITTDCWDLLGVRPEDMMCATSRMVVKRKGARRPEVVSCTLLPYDPQFTMGVALADSFASVPLNHPHCSRFCVLGGGKCSA